MKKVKVKGTQGNWLADVYFTGGIQKLPTVHREFVHGLHYIRDDGEMAKHEGKYKKWRDALLEKKMVVMTNDVWTGEPGSIGSKVRRAGYVAVYAVEEIEISGNRHSFRLCDRIANC